jgi:hypothetical protein
MKIRRISKRRKSHVFFWALSIFNKNLKGQIGTAVKQTCRWFSERKNRTDEKTIVKDIENRDSRKRYKKFVKLRLKLIKATADNQRIKQTDPSLWRRKNNAK